MTHLVSGQWIWLHAIKGFQSINWSWKLEFNVRCWSYYPYFCWLFSSTMTRLQSTELKLVTLLQLNIRMRHGVVRALVVIMEQLSQKSASLCYIYFYLYYVKFQDNSSNNKKCKYHRDHTSPYNRNNYSS